MKRGIELIAEERQEQIEKHGWENDDDYTAEDLKQAAIYCLTLKNAYYPEDWNIWFSEKIKSKQSRMTSKDFKIEMLKIAGALCAAEIDRLQSIYEME